MFDTSCDLKTKVRAVNKNLSRMLSNQILYNGFRRFCTKYNCNTIEYLFFFELVFLQKIELKSTEIRTK